MAKSSGIKKNQVPGSGYGQYTPGMLGRVAIAITTPSAIIALVSVLIALFTSYVQALYVTIITFVIAFIGSIVIVIDIVVFNRRQKKKTATKKKEKKPRDIMRAIYMIIGILVGIIIGYLVWGIRR